MHMRKRTRALTATVLVGVTLGFIGVLPANAVSESQDSSMKVTFEGETFSVHSEAGNPVELKMIEDETDHSFSVGYGEDSGATYVRTINHYVGPKVGPPAEGIREVLTPSSPDYFQTQVFHPRDEIESVSGEDMELGTVIAVNSDSATIAWLAPEGTTDVEVALDGKPVESGADQAVLNNLQPDTSYMVSVVFSTDIGDTVETLRNDYHAIRTLPTGTENPLISEKGSSAAKLAGQWSQANGLRIVTYLADQYYPTGLFAGLGCWTNPTWYFGGDNRGNYHPPTATNVFSHASHRTGYELISQFDIPPAYQGVYENKSVGYTKRYDSSYNFQDQLQASDSGMNLTNLQVSNNNHVKFIVVHDIGDPYCSVGSIEYYANVEMYYSGTISFQGKRWPVPTFEIYGAFTTSAGNSYWTGMFFGSEGDIPCLAHVGCSQESMNGSHTTY